MSLKFLNGLVQPQISHDFGNAFTFYPSFVLSELFILQVKLFMNSFQSYLFCCSCWLSYLLAIEQSIYYTIWIGICSAKYFWKHFEVVSFHESEKAWWEGMEMLEKFAYRTVVVVDFTDQNWIAKTFYCIRCVMVCKIGLTNWTAKIELLRASMVVTDYIKLFRAGADRQWYFNVSTPSSCRDSNRCWKWLSVRTYF